VLNDLFHIITSNFWSTFWVVVLFGASIFVHELGHFLAARRRGVHVERFSIGFGPAIWSRRGRDGVEYRVSWIPLGGYVMLPQLADLGPIEGENKTDISRLPPINYTSKLLILVAGAAFNILFAFALAGVIWVAGQPMLADLATTKIGPLAATIKLADGSMVANPAVEAGLKAGDVIRTVDGNAVTNFEDILNAVSLGSGRTSDGRRETTFEIERSGEKMSVVIHPVLISEDKMRFAGVEPPDTFLTVDALLPGSPAEAAGVHPGDRIIAIDGKPVFQRQAVSDHLAKNPDRASEFLFQRGDEQLTFRIQPRLETDPASEKPVARVGIRYRDVFIVVHPTPWAQISGAAGAVFHTLGALISPTSDVDPSKMSGVIGIARVLHQQAQWDIRRALALVVVINVNLAILNLLPFPVLDGGQIVFATISRLRRKELPTNVIATMQGAFIVLILVFMIYLGFSDVRRWVRDVRADRMDASSAAPAAGAAK
jgi:regulator of sigma E protease